MSLGAGGWSAYLTEIALHSHEGVGRGIAHHKVFCRAALQCFPKAYGCSLHEFLIPNIE